MVFFACRKKPLKGLREITFHLLRQAVKPQMKIAKHEEVIVRMKPKGDKLTTTEGSANLRWPFSQGIPSLVIIKNGKTVSFGLWRR